MTNKRIDGDTVEHGEVAEVWYDREYKPMWNRWGERYVMPAAPEILIDLMAQGWTLHEPVHPEARPVGKKMADGSIFMYETTARDVSEAERKRMDRDPSQLLAQASNPAPQVTATYYSPQGDAFVWPADPVSMKGYFELGFRLTPPAPKAAVRTSVKPAAKRGAPAKTPGRASQPKVVKDAVIQSR